MHALVWMYPKTIIPKVPSERNGSIFSICKALGGYTARLKQVKVCMFMLQNSITVTEAGFKV
jgi:hypothetical protein